MDRIGPNFVYTLLSDINIDNIKVGIVNHNFLVTELWPLIDVRISIPLNIWRMNGQNLTKFCIYIYIGKI